VLRGKGSLWFLDLVEDRVNSNFLLVMLFLLIMAISVDYSLARCSWRDPVLDDRLHAVELFSRETIAVALDLPLQQVVTAVAVNQQGVPLPGCSCWLHPPTLLNTTDSTLATQCQGEGVYQWQGRSQVVTDQVGTARFPGLMVRNASRFSAACASAGLQMTGKVQCDCGASQSHGLSQTHPQTTAEFPMVVVNPPQQTPPNFQARYQLSVLDVLPPNINVSLLAPEVLVARVQLTCQLLPADNATGDAVVCPGSMVSEQLISMKVVSLLSGLTSSIVSTASSANTTSLLNTFKETFAMVLGYLNATDDTFRKLLENPVEQAAELTSLSSSVTSAFDVVQRVPPLSTLLDPSVGLKGIETLLSPEFLPALLTASTPALTDNSSVNVLTDQSGMAEFNFAFKTISPGSYQLKFKAVLQQVEISSPSFSPTTYDIATIDVDFACPQTAPGQGEFCTFCKKVFIDKKHPATLAVVATFRDASGAALEFPSDDSSKVDVTNNVDCDLLFFPVQATGPFPIVSTFRNRSLQRYNSSKMENLLRFEVVDGSSGQYRAKLHCGGVTSDFISGRDTLVDFEFLQYPEVNPMLNGRTHWFTLFFCALAPLCPLLFVLAAKSTPNPFKVGETLQDRTKQASYSSKVRVFTGCYFVATLVLFILFDSVPESFNSVFSGSVGLLLVPLQFDRLHNPNSEFQGVLQTAICNTKTGC